jgi:DNA-binding CsgD family transcriptional regulator/tetratricopeptide (TPR) repeat protein
MAELVRVPGVSGPVLRGRASQCARLDELLSAVRRGESGALVLRGAAGMGKTALLDYASRLCEGWCRVIRAGGVESEMELPFAALHQLCMPLLEDSERLPAPQRDALRTAFGLMSGPRPDRFLVGLAVLTLLSDAAEPQPLACVVDDAQWLDRSSAQVLSFVARRLQAESVIVLFAERDQGQPTELAGLPELALPRLSDADARELLASSTPGRLDERVRQRITDEARGNPLALLELPRGVSSASLAGGFAVADSLPLMNRVEASFRRRVNQLPEETQRLLLLGAAEPTGDPMLLWQAAAVLGLPIEAAAPAEAADLIAVGTRVTFRHPLLRSAIYAAASGDKRRNAHRALGQATNAERDPDRRAWHRAHATLAPDEEVALELELSADRAQARGGIAAAAAFLQRAVALTVDPARRAERALAAAQASLEAGAFDAALEVLTTAEAGPLDEFQRARLDLLCGRIASASSFGIGAAHLLKAARQLEPLDLDLARETYLEAWGAAMAAGELACPGTLRDVSRAVRSAPSPAHEPLASDLLQDGLAQLVAEGLGPAAPTLRKAVSAFRDDEKVLQFGAMVATAAAALWDVAGWDAVITRQLQLARDAGALAQLATALQGKGIVVAWSGDFRGAASLIAEADAVTGAAGIRIASYGGMVLAAYQGREAEASALLTRTIENASASGEGVGVQFARWATAVLFNGLGRYAEALAAARQASDAARELFISHWTLAELVEAGVRSGNSDLAAEALERLVEAASASGTDWGLGIVARSRALMSENEAAEPLYLEAITRLGRTPLRPELGRAHLVYGEWLRRENRRMNAREQLRTAYEMFTCFGADAFAERTRRELLATGEKVRKRSDETRGQLTAQEEQIARRAAEGQTNQEIGAQLFLSPRTVEWHLHKVFTKLGVRSRMQLRGKLPDAARTAALA